MSLPRLESWDDVAAHLRALRTVAGSPGFRDLVRRVRDIRAGRGLETQSAPGLATVHDCFNDGRRRMDPTLLTDLAQALGVSGAELREWEHACFAVQNQMDSARVVSVIDNPARTESFVGRAAEITEISSTPGLWCLSGMPGIGKTQLALHLAERWIEDCTASRVIFADLRGYHPERAPADGDAMRAELLSTLAGVRVVDPEAARERLANELKASRCVLVLDDAASADQLGAILPAAVSTPVLITSRACLDLPQARHHALARLSADDAALLLGYPTSGSMPAAERAATSQIVSLLDGHPLALEVTARRITAKPDWSLADHACALSEQAELLRLPSSVNAAIELSYQRLPSAAQRLLRLIALQPGSSYAHAELNALAGQEVTALVAELTASSLASSSAGRVELHHLVRAYASTAAVCEDPRSKRDEARLRLLNHYLTAVSHAVVAAKVQPNVGARFFTEPASATGRPATMTVEQAHAWLAAERDNLLALAEPGACAVSPDYPLRLSAILARALDISGRFSDAAHLHGLARQFAQLSLDRAAEAHSEAYLGMSKNRTDPARAREHAQRALALANIEADPDSYATAHICLATIATQAGDYAAAETHTRAALDAVLTHDTTRKPASLLGNLATIRSEQGDDDAAAKLYVACRDAALTDGNVESAALAMSNLSSVHFDAGDYRSAKSTAAESVELAASIRSRLAYSVGRINLASAQTKLGELSEARDLIETVLNDVRADSHKHFETGALMAYGNVLAAAGDVEAARAAHLAGYAVAEECGFTDWVAKHQTALGELSTEASVSGGS